MNVLVRHRTALSRSLVYRTNGHLPGHRFSTVDQRIAPALAFPHEHQSHASQDNHGKSHRSPPEVTHPRLETKKDRYDATEDSRLGTPPPQALVLQKDFLAGRQDPFQALQRQLGSEHIQLHELVVSLSAAKLELFRFPRRQRLREYKSRSFGVAAKVLQRIWDRPDLWIRLTATSEALFAICWFAVAEGLDDIIIKWIQIDVSSDAAARRQVEELDDHRTGLWRASILRNLVNAQALQPTSRMDAALSSVMHFEPYDPFIASSDPLNDTIRLQSQPGTVERDGVAIRLPVMDLSGFLGTRASRNSFDTSTILFEQFIELIRRMENPRRDAWVEMDYFQIHYRIADLLLSHPKTPDPYPFLQLLAQVAVQRDGVSRVEVPDHILDGMRHCMRRAHAILNAGGDYENAEFVAQLCQNTHGKPIDSYEKHDQYRVRMPPRWNRTLKRP